MTQREKVAKWVWERFIRTRHKENRRRPYSEVSEAGRANMLTHANELLALLSPGEEEVVVDYDPWDSRFRCDENLPGNLMCQLPKGHSCDHVWFGRGNGKTPFSAERYPLTYATPKEETDV